MILLRSRPTIVLVGAMSLLCRCRALSARSLRPAFALVAGGNGVKSSRVGGSMALALSSFPVEVHRSPRSSDIRSHVRIGTNWGVTTGTSYFGHGSLGLATAARANRRRRRSAMGMVSDQPFRSPVVEETSEEDFRSLGLQGDLVEAMDKFGEEILTPAILTHVDRVLNMCDGKCSGYNL